MDSLFKGVLIDQSVERPEAILKLVHVVNTREATLEGESFRGKVLFHNIEVSSDNLWPVLSQVARTIKSPGWYFHLVHEDDLYIVMPSVIMLARKGSKDMQTIVNYATSHGIHPDQLNLKQLFENPFA